MILENIECLIEYVPFNKSFNKSIYLILKLYLDQETGNGNNLMIIGTTRNINLLNELGFSDCFNSKIEVSDLTSENEIESVVKNVKGDLIDLPRFISPIAIKDLISLAKLASCGAT